MTFNFAKIDKKTDIKKLELILRERLNLSHERKNLLHDRYAIAAYISAFLDGLLTQSLVTYPERSLGLHFFFF